MSILVSVNNLFCFFPKQWGNVHEFNIHIKSLETESIEKIGHWTIAQRLTFYKENMWSFHQFRNKTFTVLILPVSFFLKMKFGSIFKGSKQLSIPFSQVVHNKSSFSTFSCRCITIKTKKLGNGRGSVLKYSKPVHSFSISSNFVVFRFTKIFESRRDDSFNSAISS